MTTSPPASVAVIGLGAMGLPMATRLAAHMPVRVFDLATERLDAAAAAGAEPAATPALAAAGCPVVLIAVRTLAQVESSLFGPDGAAGALGVGAVVVLTSTVGAAGARAVAARLAEHDIELLDLPVSGGPRRAGAGDLLALVGGRESARATAAAVVGLIASTVVPVGSEPGDGQAMKTVNQLLCGVHIAAAAEALALAKGLGIDPRAALAALGAGAGASFMLSDRGPRIVDALDGTTPDVLSRVDIFVKDMGIVTDAARRAGVATPVAAAAEQLYLLGQAAGMAGADDGTVALLLARPSPPQ